LLFVVHKKGIYQGMPLSTKGFGKIYSSIQEADPEEFGNLTSHVLRHTKNERFAAEMKRSNIPSALAEKAQSYMSGWRYGSRTASTYTQGHIEEVTNEAMLKLQKFPKKKGVKHE
jgi:hypothetical protein